ncbi:MAG: patatin-like phospholipase family protein [Bacteroidia bacterium]
MTTPDAPQGIEKLYQAGDEVIVQGTRPGCVYWVAEGRLETHVVDAEGNSKWLGEISQGEFFGEMAAITGKPASANVRAVSACRLVCIAYDEFFALIEESPAWNRELLRSISLRAQRMYRPPSKNKVLWLQPLGEEVDERGFLSRLQQLIGSHGSNIVLDRSEVTDWDARVQHCREAFDFTLLIGDRHDIEWNSFCERESDKCILLGNGEKRPPLPTSPGIPQWGKPCELVLLHRSRRESPKGTAQWLDSADISNHYHIAADHAADWERLARCLTGNAIGLVCSGGGARGAAHLGLVSALVEVGIPIDYLIGTSAGALMTVCHAMAMPREDYLGFLEEISRKSRRLTDYTFPFLSLLAGKTFNAIMERYAGDWAIEDLWLPFACVSSSLSTGKVVAHRRGPLLPALKASTAIPGIFAPQELEGEILVDGGLLNNAPTDIAKLFPAGKLILSDMSKWSPIHFKGKFPDTSSGWRLLFRYLNPFHSARFRPILPAIILKSYELSALHLQEEKLLNHPPDLTIRIPVHEFGTLDFHAVRRIWDLGYAMGLEQGAAWKARLSV